MKRSLFIRTLPCILATAYVSVGLISSKAICGETMELTQQLDPNNLDKQLAAHESARERTRVAMTKSLKSGDPQVQFAAAYLLGIYRYDEAVNDLAKAITLHDDVIRRNTRIPRWDRFPAAEALVRIGKPSLRAMLANLETSDDEHVRGLSARVIFYVEGPDTSKTAVQNAIKAQSDPEKKKRLETALPLVKGGDYQIPPGR